MTPPVVGDATKALGSEEEHLLIPRICIQRPAMGERDDRPSAPVLIEDLGAIFCLDSCHGKFLREGLICSVRFEQTRHSSSRPGVLLRAQPPSSLRVLF